MTDDDSRWQTLEGGYRTVYDPRPALQALELGEDRWDELWEELHHQGDVGTASYAAVSILARSARDDIHLYALVSTIEIERHRPGNPPLPDWLREEYREAWALLKTRALAELSECRDPLRLRTMMGVLALAAGCLRLGTVLAHSDESELQEIQSRFGPVVDSLSGWG